jgi:hypothetical protein
LVELKDGSALLERGLPVFLVPAGSTYKEFRHDSAGIPPYKMVNVPSPKDFKMRESDEGDFTRFAISSGYPSRLEKVPK